MLRAGDLADPSSSLGVTVTVTVEVLVVVPAAVRTATRGVALPPVPRDVAHARPPVALVEVDQNDRSWNRLRPDRLRNRLAGWLRNPDRHEDRSRLGVTPTAGVAVSGVTRASGLPVALHLEVDSGTGPHTNLGRSRGRDEQGHDDEDRQDELSHGSSPANWY